MNFTLYLAKLIQVHPEKPDMQKRRIACIGDSITFGAGVVNTRKQDAWPYVWNRLLGDHFQLIDYGVSGATMQDEGDFPYHKVGFLKRLPKVKPEVITLMLGTNDTKPYNWNKERFVKEYEAMIKEIRNLAPSARLVLMTPPKAFAKENSDLCEYEIDNRPNEEIIRPLVFSLGKQYGLEVIDLYALTEEHPEYFDDGVHPNVTGNQKIGEYLHNQVRF